MKRITRLALGTFSGTAVALAPAGPSPAATADTAADTPADTTAGTTVTFKPDGRSAKAAGETITCVITTSAPRVPRPAEAGAGSGKSAKAAAKAGRTVKAVGRVKCDHPVTGISIRAGLYKDGLRYEQSAVKVLTHTSGIVQSAARRCASRATYTSAVISEIKAPSGYKPRRASGTAISDPVRITACDHRTT
ncbi:hypothetical protein AB0J52_00485 [Spirillospora sp. NPDC049652]